VKSTRASVWLAGVSAANLIWGSSAGGAEAFITDQTGDEVSVLDLKSKQVVARIPVCRTKFGRSMLKRSR
jgi:YVTN family beta-propeller protein